MECNMASTSMTTCGGASRRRGSVARVAGIASAVVVLGAFVLLWTRPPPRVQRNSTGKGYVELFSDMQRGRPLEIRRAAAAELATRVDGAAYTAILLCGADALGPSDPEAEKERQWRGHDSAVIAALLQGIGNGADFTVLWAVTCQLKNRERGVYWRDRWLIPGVMKRVEDCKTEPVADIAREVLRRNLRVDHGYDAEKWRRELTQRAVGQAGKR